MSHFTIISTMSIIVNARSIVVTSLLFLDLKVNIPLSINS